MEKKILLDQLDDRIKRAIALIVHMYPKLKTHELSDNDAKGIIKLADSLKFLISVVQDIEYNDNLDKYKGEIFKIARGNSNE